MAGKKEKKVDSFYATYEAEMALVTDTKGGDKASKIIRELKVIENELHKQARAASPEMVVRKASVTSEGEEAKPYKPEHWNCFDKCFSCCFYGCFLPDTF